MLRDTQTLHYKNEIQRALFFNPEIKLKLRKIK